MDAAGGAPPAGAHAAQGADEQGAPLQLHEPRPLQLHQPPAQGEGHPPLQLHQPPAQGEEQPPVKQEEARQEVPAAAAPPVKDEPPAAAAGSVPPAAAPAKLEAAAVPPPPAAAAAAQQQQQAVVQQVPKAVQTRPYPPTGNTRTERMMYSRIPQTTLRGPWTFLMLGIPRFTRSQYAQFLDTADWTLDETVTLLYLITQNGVSVESWLRILKCPALAIRHPTRNQCESRFLHVYAMAKMYIDNRGFYARQVAQRRMVLRKHEREQKKKEADRQKALARKNRTARRRSAPVTPAPVEPDVSSGRRSSSRLGSKARARYVFDSDSDFEVDDDSDSDASDPSEPEEAPEPPMAASVAEALGIDLEAEAEAKATRAEAKAEAEAAKASGGDKAAKGKKAEAGDDDEDEEEEEVLEPHFKADRVLAVRTRPVLVPFAHVVEDSSDSDSSDDDGGAGNDSDDSDASGAEPSSPVAKRTPSRRAAARAAAGGGGGSEDAAEDVEMADADADAKPAENGEEKKDDADADSKKKKEKKTVTTTVWEPVDTKEYLVKMRGQSFLHAQWMTEEEMAVYFGYHTSRLTKTFETKREKIEAENDDIYEGEPFDPAYLEVERVLAVKTVRVPVVANPTVSLVTLDLMPDNAPPVPVEDAQRPYLDAARKCAVAGDDDDEAKAKAGGDDAAAAAAAAAKDGAAGAAKAEAEAEPKADAEAPATPAVHHHKRPGDKEDPYDGLKADTTESLQRLPGVVPAYRLVTDDNLELQVKPVTAMPPYPLHYLFPNHEEAAAVQKDPKPCSVAGGAVRYEERTVCLVKWTNVSFAYCTWELEEDIKLRDELKIAEFRRFGRRPMAQARPPPPDKEDPKRTRYYETSRVYKLRHKLRDYQVTGINWMISNFYDNRNAILADEMGLGKTVQCVSFLEHLNRVEKIRGPFLVVVPLSTIEHWKREADGWTDMNAIVYYDQYRGKQTRALMRKLQFWFGGPGPRTTKFNIMVTTYETVMSDLMELSEVNWEFLIVDEGHRLKNRGTKLLEALQQLNCRRRMLLTGTPIQNNTAELWTLLNFLEPGRFSSDQRHEFDERFAQVEGSDQVAELQKMMRPYILRRLKETVEKSIPAKEETIIDIELTTMQKKYYKAIYERNIKFLRTGVGSSGNVPRLVNVEMELRKCCNHPWLVKGTEEKEVPAGCSDREYFDATVQASGKMVLLDKLLPKLKADGHRVLIFSQMKRQLDILEDYLVHRQHSYERIDGNVVGNRRQRAIDRYCRPGSTRFVFLLSTRAGGVGLNLMAADTVIIYDSDWNPQQDLQAQARVHRIGQKNSVRIYRLVTSRTYEAEMFDRASKKLGLDRAVLTGLTARGARGTATKGGGKAAPAQEIETVLRHGAYALMGEEGEEESRKFCEADINDILSQRTRSVVYGGGAASFAKATFQSEDADASLDINDPDFWDKMIPLTEEERLNPDRLLGQLTDTTSSVLRDSSSRSEFFDEVRQSVELTIKKRDAGEPVPELDSVVNLCIQLSAMSQFSRERRAVAEQWLAACEKRPARRARRSGEARRTQGERRGGGRAARKGKRKVAKGARRAARGRGRRVASSDDDDEEDDEDEEEDADMSSGGSSGAEYEDEGAASDDEEDAAEDDEESDGGAAAEEAALRERAERSVCAICFLGVGLRVCTGPCRRPLHPKCSHAAAAAAAEAPKADGAEGNAEGKGGDGGDGGNDDKAKAEAPEAEAEVEAEAGTDQELALPVDVSWQCESCVASRHACAACGQAGPLDGGEDGPGGEPRKCSHAQCGRYFHQECARNMDLTMFFGGGGAFRCPQHVCESCEKTTVGKRVVLPCVRCTAGVHASCSRKITRLSPEGQVLCEQCTVQMDGTDAGRRVVESSQECAKLRVELKKRRAAESRGRKKAEAAASRDRKKAQAAAARAEAKAEAKQKRAAANAAKRTGRRAKRERADAERDAEIIEAMRRDAAAAYSDAPPPRKRGRPSKAQRIRDGLVASSSEEEDAEEDGGEAAAAPAPAAEAADPAGADADGAAEEGAADGAAAPPAAAAAPAAVPEAGHGRKRGRATVILDGEETHRGLVFSWRAARKARLRADGVTRPRAEKPQAKEKKERKKRKPFEGPRAPRRRTPLRKKLSAEEVEQHMEELGLNDGVHWCRYCGARAASGWNRGPWGPRMLCTPHYVAWHQKGTVNLDEYTEEPERGHPIDPTQNTEANFVAYAARRHAQSLESANGGGGDSDGGGRKRRRYISAAAGATTADLVAELDEDSDKPASRRRRSGARPRGKRARTDADEAAGDGDEEEAAGDDAGAEPEAEGGAEGDAEAGAEGDADADADADAEDVADAEMAA